MTRDGSPEKESALVFFSQRYIYPKYFIFSYLCFSAFLQLHFLEMKLGLQLRGLFVLWVPRRTALHSVNTLTTQNKARETRCFDTFGPDLWQRAAAFLYNGRLMDRLFLVFGFCHHQWEILIEPTEKAPLKRHQWGVRARCQHFSPRFVMQILWKTSLNLRLLPFAVAELRRGSPVNWQRQPLNIFPPRRSVF